MQLLKYSSVFPCSEISLSRNFHASSPKKIWPVVIGIGVAGAAYGASYLLRTVDRIQKKKMGNFETDENESPQEKMQYLLGVDLGLSKMCLSVSDLHKKTEILISPDGARTTPAFISVRNNHVQIGSIAKSYSYQPNTSAFATQKFIKMKQHDQYLEDILQQLQFDVVADENGFCTFNLNGEKFSPELIAELMYEHLLQIACDVKSTPDTAFNTVLAQRPEFTQLQCEANIAACTKSGMNVIACIDEPSASIISAEVLLQEIDSSFQFKNNCNYLVFDMGGVDSSASVVKKNEFSYDLLKSRTTSSISGKLVDDHLVENICSSFFQNNGINLLDDFMAKSRILDEAQKAKIELSSMLETTINLPFITADSKGPKHLVQTLRRSSINNIMESPLRVAFKLCNEVIKDSNITIEEIDGVLLCGGGSRSPVIQKSFKKAFSSKVVPVDPSVGFSPDEAVALGAAEYGKRLL